MNEAVRGRQVKPTKKEMDAAWLQLREKANEGNLLACGLVVALTGDRSQAPGTPEFIDQALELGQMLIKRIQALPGSEVE